MSWSQDSATRNTGSAWLALFRHLVDTHFPNPAAGYAAGRVVAPVPLEWT
ncbi:hypothetical protein [Azospirillum melinis]